MVIEEIYNKLIINLEKNKHIVKNLKENPESIFNLNEDSLKILSNVISINNDYTMDDFLKEISSFIFPYLSEKLNKDFHFKISNFAISISYKNYNLGYLDIIKKVLSISSPIHIEIHKETLKNFEEHLKSKKEFYEKLETKETFKTTKNIFKFFIYSLFKKSDQDIDKLKDETEKSINSYKLHIDREKLVIEEYENDKEIVDSMIKELEEFFKQYNYEVIS